MKRQTMAIGIIALLFLLVIFSYTKGEFSDYHTLPIEELNVNSIQGINQLVVECNTCGIDDDKYSYPIMRPDSETLIQWIEQYNNAPKTTSNIDSNIKMKASPEDDNFSLLSHLYYIPNERNQGNCENCWAWAGTGILGIALDVQENIKDRLSVQYINSCVSDIIGVTCCYGGFLSDVVNFYENTSKAIPWSNTNASWQDGDASCTTYCGTISTSPRYPITSISEETIVTHDVTNLTAIANIRSVLSQNKAVWFAFFLPTNNNWLDFFNNWFDDNESSIYDIDKFSGNQYNTGGGHAVLCVGWGQTDPANQYWIMLNSWGNRTNRPNGLFLIDMDMNYNSRYPGLSVNGNNYSFYWQTLNVTFDIDTPKVITNETTNVEETSAKLFGYLQSNGSVDTNCFFVWDNDSGEPYDNGNQSIGLVENKTEFNYNLSNLTKGELYYYNTKANNIAGWNDSGGEHKFLTRPDTLISFNASMVNSSKIVLTWTEGTGGDGAYIEYNISSQSNPWNIGDGMAIDDNGYATSPFNHTNLSSNTHYYYKTWSYAEKDGWKSNGNTTAPFGNNPQTENNKTNALSTVDNESPSENETEIDKMRSTVNVTVEDLDGDTINWTIHGMNIIQNSSSYDINGSKSANLTTPLPYDTNIIWYVNVTDGYDWTNETYNFTTRSKYIPDVPSSFFATAYNRTQINLTWTNAENNNTYIEYNTTSEIWTKEEGNFLYNGTNLSCNHENLLFNSQYLYKAWSYNVTDNVYSATNITANDTTLANQAPTISEESPSNNTVNLDINQAIINITISDPEGDPFNWTIHGTYVISNSSTEDSAGSKSADLNAPLPYDTNIIWYVNITDGYLWTNETYDFNTQNQFVPNPPDNFTANSKSKSRIDLSWIKGNNADKTYIRYKQGSTPPDNRTDGEELGNYSGESASATGLKSGRKYSFIAWSWNDTGNSWSTTNATSFARTDSGSSSGGIPPVISPPEDETTEDEETNVKDQVENIFNITIDHNFFANDTDKDGMLKLEDFDDPNGLLSAERLVNISGNYSYLISVNGSKEDIFIWDTEADTATEVTYYPVNVESTIKNIENDAITITVYVNKSKWIYIEIFDDHPDISNLTVKTSYGGVISTEMIFRENGKIYVLDDPDTEYLFVYRYAIFSPIFNPVSGSTLNISKPAISITYNETLTVIESTFNGESINMPSTIITDTSASKHTFIYTPEMDLSNGNYTLSLTVKDNENNSRTDTATYIINAEPI